jgi:hypothetical protein
LDRLVDPLIFLIFFSESATGREDGPAPNGKKRAFPARGNHSWRFKGAPPPLQHQFIRRFKTAFFEQMPLKRRYLLYRSVAPQDAPRTFQASPGPRLNDFRKFFVPCPSFLAQARAMQAKNRLGFTLHPTAQIRLGVRRKIAPEFRPGISTR